MPGLPSRFWEYVSRSTLKREAASIAMLWLLSMATFLMVTATTFEQKFMVLSAFNLPIMSLFGLAFGADFVAKQTTIAGPPQVPGVKPDIIPDELEVSGTLKVDDQK